MAKDRFAAIGWCWGAGKYWRFATAEPKLKAVRPNPPLETVPNIHAPVLGVCGGQGGPGADA